MKNIGLNELRQMFREFYVARGHYARKSFSLVPESDKSLLLINSGMAPLKPYFAGIEAPPSKRMTTCQKCIRTGDLENVGLTARHGTFFEMLGSFSFGDYFKRESLKWGWEFITEVLEMPADKLWASIYEEDDEAYDIWVNEVGISPGRVVRMGKEDNFWEIGIGPCGPCSEIYFDRGEKYGCGSADCRPGCECDRFVEFWNHVFTQYSRDEAGNYTPLSHPNIDTGMGLERLACIMQGTDSIFDVDTIRTILERVCGMSGVAYQRGEAKTDVSVRIVTDHIRSVVFLIGDGVIPSNEGRGYVLRRLLRRAAVHGKKLGIEGLFLHELAENVIEVSGREYDEIIEKRDYIRKLIRLEEERFAATVDSGLALLDAHIAELKGVRGAVLAGDKVFKLYDTYGVNPELTREALAEHGISIDEEGFLAELRIQQENSRRGQKASDGAAWRGGEELFKGLAATEFVGYVALQEKCSVKLIVKDGFAAEEACGGETVLLVLDKTPFYAEGGGQASDAGVLAGDGAFADVLSVARSGAVWVHTVLVKSGAIRVGDVVNAAVDPIARNRTARNHTATHLLHKALVQTLGGHVRQAGSSVDAETLRFDFTHFEGLGADKLSEAEAIVNRVIDEFQNVFTTETTVDEAKARGAAAYFDEKYGDKVRLVEVGEFSAELCGGTHVSNSGQIGGFRIVSETSIGSGTRRIEAITGTNLLRPLLRAENTLAELSGLFKAHPDMLMDKVSGLLGDMKEMRRELDAANKAKAGGTVSELLAAAREKGGARLVTGVFGDLDAGALRALSDSLKAASGGLVNVLVSTAEGKVTIVASVSDDLLDKGLHAGKLIKELAQAAGGGGGGKADMAQAGAKDPAKVPDILAAAENYLSSAF
ncbi:MAG: alanine--tRNA ligase [Clostridiales Family XIII bacterium]|jgi:alanyl-tRNA synthetase|nr:alanine--tRNA ligase [Clostridiales Family XIII bacterium]